MKILAYVLIPVALLIAGMSLLKSKVASAAATQPTPTLASQTTSVINDASGIGNALGGLWDAWA